MSETEWFQSISCRDIAGRDRDIQVRLGAKGIVVVSPPGEVAHLNNDESKLLREALTVAEDHRSGRKSSS